MQSHTSADQLVLERGSLGAQTDVFRHASTQDEIRHILASFDLRPSVQGFSRWNLFRFSLQILEAPRPEVSAAVSDTTSGIYIHPSETQAAASYGIPTHTRTLTLTHRHTHTSQSVGNKISREQNLTHTLGFIACE